MPQYPLSPQPLTPEEQMTWMKQQAAGMNLTPQIPQGQGPQGLKAYMPPKPQSVTPVPRQRVLDAQVTNDTHKVQQLGNEGQGATSQLEQYLKDYQNQPQETDFSALGSYLASINPQYQPLAQQALATRPESQQARNKDILGIQKQIIDEKLANTKLAASEKQQAIANAISERRASSMEALSRASLERSNYMGQRLGYMSDREARASVNNDKLLNTYTPRLEGAAKISELINAAKSGKVVSNQAFLGQLNQEITRLETGSQAPGLHNSEKTELLDRAAQIKAVYDSISGNPQDAVRPEVINTADKMVNELSGSYKRAIDSRMEELKGGMTESQQGIVNEKHKSLKDTYGKRLGGWGTELAPPIDANLDAMTPEQVKAWMDVHGG